MIYPRSTEGVIYYLGEITRHQLSGPDQTVMVRGGGDRPLFVVHRGLVAGALTQVTFMGQTYAIAADNEERTTQVLSLLTQLISLNKSAKDLPATNVFTIVGR